MQSENILYANINKILKEESDMKTNAMKKLKTDAKSALKENTLIFVDKGSILKHKLSLVSCSKNNNSTYELHRGGLQVGSKIIHHFREDSLVLICNWQFCDFTSNDWIEFKKHMAWKHLGEVNIMLVKKEKVKCGWEGCSSSSSRLTGHKRHLNLHCFQVPALH